MFTERIESGINGNRLIFEDNGLTNVGYKARMILENHIPGFLECSIVHADGCDSYVYDITSMTSLYNIYEHKEMDYSMLYGLINSIACGLESAGEYLLPCEHLVLDPKFIYIEKETGKIFWCYYPGYYNTLKDGMNELAEYILQKANHKEDAATELAYGLYKQVVNEDYTLRKLLSRHEEMTIAVRNNDGKKEGEESFLIEDDKDLYMPDKDDAPVIPVPGKMIISVCLFVILLLSGFVLASALYPDSPFARLLSLNEMRIFICMTEAMAMLLPVLITVKWIDQSRRFRKMIMDAGIDDGAELYRQIAMGSDCLNPQKSMVL